jgi:hypothetical protein
MCWQERHPAAFPILFCPVRVLSRGAIIQMRCNSGCKREAVPRYAEAHGVVGNASHDARCWRVIGGGHFQLESDSTTGMASPSESIITIRAASLQRRPISTPLA